MVGLNVGYAVGVVGDFVGMGVVGDFVGWAVGEGVGSEILQN